MTIRCLRPNNSNNADVVRATTFRDINPIEIDFLNKDSVTLLESYYLTVLADIPVSNLFSSSVEQRLDEYTDDFVRIRFEINDLNDDIYILFYNLDGTLARYYYKENVVPGQRDTILSSELIAVDRRPISVSGSSVLSFTVFGETESSINKLRLYEFVSNPITLGVVA